MTAHKKHARFKIKRYAKFIVALTGAAVIAATQIWGDEVGQEVNKWATAIVAFLTALGVYGVRNAQD